VNKLVDVSPEVRAALDEGRPVVALETTLVAHGFPAPDGVEVGLERACDPRGRRDASDHGGIDGRIRVGLSEGPRALHPAARKVGPRDLAACVVAGDVGATTVGGLLIVARKLGIHFLATGGVGGVHRRYP
jgi:pseudouridine-5'-phosphate glycosidase